ncbi:PREDICTED: uncharacterized protein MAL8P1.12-like isoform X2 [Amphimedon queenslandica]|uniref:Death domain-containing protein n=1 Tax=Amphimedon queenslandica TaxID=400682 RepID=A0AAN0JKD7_AMPQE|nr:PREDICTED: uncharacterized protein MAL8P1.12-like isoform X2 [Amphimedon queenslandica]|eukprot:XP_019857168.1 PREDICTED: uncharacterized protein MAL8P1.12-like isoform X2 [Amphimedon queenslandica]
MAEVEWAGPRLRFPQNSEKEHLGLKSSQQQLLSIVNLVEILDLLRKHQYSGTDYHDLGLRLGLSPRTLDIITKDHTGDVNSCLKKCLEEWLKQSDNSMVVAGPTYDSLIKALRNINQNAVADGIDREKHPACVIFSRCKSDQSIVNSLPQLAILLHKEKIIVEQIVPKEVSALLIEVKDAICADYRNLEKFIFILMKLNNEPVTSIADSMLKEYINFNLPLELNEEFTRIRNKFGDLLDDVANAMDDTVDVEKLKKYVSRSNKHLRSGLALCQSTDEVVQLIGDDCSLINTALLEGIIDRFKVDKAEAAMKIYKDEIEKFYKEPLHRCLNKQLASFSPLHCETAFITVDQNIEDYKLKDIQDLMTVAFQRLAPHIKVIFIIRANSFSIICSFPLVLSESLVAAALENIELLIEKNVQKLIIGYCIMYDRDQVIKECEGKDLKHYITSSEFYSSVYTSKSTMEQLQVSKKINLLSLGNYETIEDLEQGLEDEGRGAGLHEYESVSAGQLQAMQKDLNIIKEEKIKLEHKLYEEKRKSNELQRRLDNPLPNERANRVERDNEFLRHDKWKLEERLKEEKRNSEEWRHKYEQAAHSRPNPVEDELRRRNGMLNQEIATLNQHLQRERGIFQMKVRQVEEVDAKLHSQELRYSELDKAYQREKRNIQNLKDYIANLEKEVLDLTESKGKLKSDLEDCQCKLKDHEKLKIDEMKKFLAKELVKLHGELMELYEDELMIEKELDKKDSATAKTVPGSEPNSFSSS